MRPLLVVALLAGCQGSPDLGPAFVAPFDGQTGVPVDFEPELSFALDLPPDEAIDQDTIGVVDLDSGEAVRGHVTLTPATIAFEPNEPLAAGHDFAWSVQAPEEEPRGPSVLFPPTAVGTADFSTRPDLEAVAGWRDPALQTPCVLLSRAAGTTELSSVVPTVDGEDRDADWTALPLEDVSVPGDPGVTAACLTRGAVDEGAVLRVTIGSGMWAFPLEDGDPDAILQDLRRWSD